MTNGILGSIRRHRTGYLLAAPGVVVLGAVFVGAMLTLLEYSFHRSVPGGGDVGGTAATWRSFVTGGYHWKIIRETVVLGLLTTVITALVGYPTAYALHRVRRPAWRYVGLFIVFAPLLTSVVARTYGWELLLGDNGVINAALGVFGVGPVEILYQRAAVVLALVHILLPFMVFPITSSLGQVDPALGEAAGDLGAGAARRFTKVTLPLTLPGLIAGAELVFALAISSFATPSLLGGGRVNVLATDIYNDVGNVDWPMAAVSSYALLALAAVALAVFGWLQRQAGGGGQGGVTAAGAAPAGARGWGIWLLVVDVFVLMPLAIIIVDSFSSVSYGTWPPPGLSLKWYANLFDQTGLGSAALLSLEVALAATVISVAIGTAMSTALVRDRMPGRRAIESFALSPTVVPKVAFGFAGFIYLHRLGLFGGVTGLVVTHVVIVLPFVVIVLTAALMRADTTLEAAARDLGASPLRAFRLVTIPQIRPALIAAALFAFVVSFDEVDMTVFLLAPDQNTLPVWMFVYLQKYQDPTLAALSALLIAAALLIAGAVAFLLARSGVFSSLTGSDTGTPADPAPAPVDNKIKEGPTA
ncbi:ABC transporter permease subunit [Actinoallomurus acaciae]|uniref:ABC transporter permease subunit n=1 Tax=Actinoallomurus acaciae TaxID=502577 RepID=A0ABV5YLR5_9ACTN